MEKINIWGSDIPYNESKKKKVDSMTIRHKWKPVVLVRWAKAIFGSSIVNDTSGFDTYTYYEEIKKGKVSEYFDDVPNIIPYLVKDSDAAIIVAPGGGFSMQCRENEGYKVAEYLNKKKISVFVLEYRMNPYRAPVCYLDMQRAIRYVRYHAREFGINPHKIGTMGFSAGGYVVGGAAILLGNQEVSFPGYTPDEVDGMNGLPDFMCMAYPVTDFDENPNMLCMLAGEEYFDESKRGILKTQYSLTENLASSNVPQFFCYGTKDILKGMDRYAKRLDELNIPHETIVLEGAGHGFVLNPRYIWWWNEFMKWIASL